MGSHQKRVAVIGAGVSGIVSAKHLKEFGLEVVVFERSRQAGGNWLVSHPGDEGKCEANDFRVYDERKPIEPNYPSVTPSIADFVVEGKGKTSGVVDEAKSIDGERGYTSEEEDLRFAPPGYVFVLLFYGIYVDSVRPAYSGLTNNVSTKLQHLKGFPWKEGTPDFVNVRAKQEYLQSYSKHFGIETLIRYNTRVEKLQKTNGKWWVNSTTLVRDGTRKGKHANEFEVRVNIQTGA